MATETNTLIFEVKKVNVDPTIASLIKLKEAAKEVGTATQALAKYSTDPFAKLAKSAGQFGDTIDRLNSIQKINTQIQDEAYVIMRKHQDVIDKLTQAIHETTDAKQKEQLVDKLSLEVAKASIDTADRLKAEYIELNNVYKAGVLAIEKHTASLADMNAIIDSIRPGAERLAEVWRSQIQVEKDLAIATKQSAMARNMLENALKSETNALKKEELQEQINILKQREASAEIAKNVQVQKLHRDVLREKANIRTKANDVLAVYKLKLKDATNAIKAQKDGISKLTVIYREERKIEEEAVRTLSIYDKRLQTVNVQLGKAKDKHEANALALKRKALIEAQSNTVIAKNIALMKLANDVKKQEKFLLKEASVKTLEYNDNIKKLNKQITDENNVLRKVTISARVLNEVRREGVNLEKHYKNAVDKVEGELKQNISAEKRLALEMKKKALIEAQGNAITATTNNLLLTKRLRIKAVSTALVTASQSIMRFGRVMSRYFTTVLIGAIAQGVKFAANIEAQTVRFQILTQSMEKGKRLFQEIIEFSARTPFQLPDLDEAAQVLLAFGSPLGSVMDELRMLGDIAMGDAEKLERIAMSFGKVRSRGTAHMRELNRFIMSGVPIIGELNKQLELSGDTLFKMIAKNKISFENINTAVKSLTDVGGRFYQMTEKVAETLKGRWSTAIDNMNLNLAKLMEDFTPRLKAILEGFIDWSQAFRTLDDDSRKTLVNIIALTAAIGPLSIAFSGFLKMVSLTVLGRPVGLLIAGLTLLVGAVSWGVLKKKMDMISETATELKANTELLTESLGYQDNMLPGLTKEMYDIADAYDAWGLAVEHARERSSLKERLDSDDILSSGDSLGDELFKGDLQGVLTILDDIEKTGITVGINYNWFSKAKGYLVNDLKNYFGNLADELPAAESVINEAIKDAIGTEKDIGALTKGQLESIKWDKLARDLAPVVGKDVGEFREIITAALQKKWEDLGTGEGMLSDLGVAPADILAEWGVSTKKGLDTITGDLEDGIIDFSASIRRTMGAIDELPTLEEKVLGLIESGDIGETEWKSHFEEGISVEEIIKQVVADTANAMEEYTQLLKDMVDLRIYEIKDESAMDNLIARVLGITDEKDIKKQLETQLDSYADLIKSFDISFADLEIIESGGQIEDELMQTLVEKVIAGVRGAKQELDALIEAEEKISLFKAFFEGDTNVFKKSFLQGQLDALGKELSLEMGGISYEYIDSMNTVINDLVEKGGGLKSPFQALWKEFLKLEGLDDLIGTPMSKLSKNLLKVHNTLAVFSTESTDPYDIIKSIIAITEALAKLDEVVEKEVPTLTIQDVLETYFGAGTAGDAQKAVEDLFNQINFNTAITTALANMPASQTPTTLIEILKGDEAQTKLLALGIAQVTIDTLMTSWETVVEDAVIDTKAHQSILELLVGEPETMQQDLEDLLAKLNYEKALSDLVESLKGTSSIDLLTDVLDTNLSQEGVLGLLGTILPSDIQATDAWKAFVESAKALPEELAKEVDNTSMLTSFIGDPTKFAYDAYTKTLVDNLNTRLLVVAKSRGISLEELLLLGNKVGFGESLQASIDEIFDRLKIPEKTPMELALDSLIETIKGGFLPAFKEMGEVMATSDNWFDGVTAGLDSFVKSIWDAMPSMLFELGWGLLSKNILDPVGWSLLAASGLTAAIQGAMSADAGSVEEVSTVDVGSRSLTPSASRGFGGDTTIVVNNNSTARVDTTETTNADGSRGIEFTVYDMVNKGFASGEFDNSMSRSFGTKRQGRR